MWALQSRRGGLCEDGPGTAPCWTQPAATIPPQDTAEHISHCQMWKNIFKKGHRMPEREVDRERTERGGDKGEITART